MASTPSLVENVGQLLARGDRAGAVTLVERSASHGDAHALLTLAAWRLGGQVLRRDLAEARDLFRRAAEAGNDDAARVHNGFLAHGAGGASDWQAAMALLRTRARSNRETAEQLAVIGAMQLTPDGEPMSLSQGRVLSGSPYVQLFPKAFTPAECAYLARAAEPLMAPAVTVHPQTGRQLVNPIRTSDTAAFPLVLENPAVHALNRRIAALSRIPVSHGEPLQVLRYGRSQEYRAHLDALPGTDNQRVVTVLVYLNDDYAGGETHFSANGLSVRGRTGDALLFRNVTADGRADERSVHAGLPVTRGVKLIASRWIRARPLDLGG